MNRQIGILLAATSAILLLSACSKGHDDIYNYDNLYLTDSISDFKMSHFKKHISENILYLNADPEFNKSDFQADCRRNEMNCIAHDLSLTSASIEAQLTTTLDGLKQFAGRGALVVSSNKDNAGLFFSSYALREKGASLETAKQIATDIGASSVTLDKILEFSTK